MRFIKPVFIGDTIRASATIKEKRDHPRRASHGIVVEFLEVSNQDSENVLACAHLYLVERPSAGPLPLWTKIANAWHLDSLFEFVCERSGLKHFDA